MKYYVKELYTDNQLYFEALEEDILNNFNHDFFALSNRCCGGLNEELINTLSNGLYNYSDYCLELYYKNHYVNFIIDTLKPYKKISLQQAIKIMLLLKDNTIKEDNFIIETLNILYGGRYEKTILRGYCQSDWIVCFYNVDIITSDFLRYIEAVFFNTGIEIMIHDEETIPNTPEEISGNCDYIVNNTSEEKKKAVAALIGCDVNDLIYYEIKDIEHISYYKEIYEEVK